ncbi:MAG TPA: A/G-specific adenine glycosylase [Segetibacter sp.]|nr:A/G-specific adenine glycosylase [Segetibacter sp.]
MKKNFTRKIIEWHLKVNKRTMPWKGEKDPYKVWISEIILQQTRVEQGLLYYNNFIKDFPTVKSLALASDEVVFKAWEGLGYYSRCKNIILTAKKIVNDLNGNFPCTYDELIALKGIGPYTAAAISSFAYGLPHAVVDGNVFRVLARYFGEGVPIDSAKGREYFTSIANELLFKKDPAAYNQAIIDFGATVCKPKVAECSYCILQKNCIAYKQGLVNRLPFKEKQLTRKKRWFTYFIFLMQDMVLVNKRVQKDIWENLYEFYLFETDKEWEWNPEVITKWLKDQLDIERFEIKKISNLFIQQLTHQNLQGRFITIRLDHLPAALLHLKPVNKEDFVNIPFPKLINQYLFSDKIL